METIKQKKSHETPEFEVIRQNEANSKFFVASAPFAGISPTSGFMNSSASDTEYKLGDTSEW